MSYIRESKAKGNGMKQEYVEIQEYPIGQQDFKTLREENLIYVDKTKYIATILRRKMQYLFLARPRRFGKSLFLSTLRYFFEGKRHLFKGLYIDSIDWNWESYPVLYLDLNPDRYADDDDLDNRLEEVFAKWENIYEVEGYATGYSSRFRNIIESAHRKTGRQVVILVDEYDKPLVNNLKYSQRFDSYREKLASLYSNFKTSAEHIRLVFLTGVSRFGKLSVFSDINNLKDITINEDFSDICGISEDELNAYFPVGIRQLASAEGLTFDEACSALKMNYDGYRFSRNGSEIYNPWSLLNALQDSAIDDYWVRTGNPTIVVETLRDKDVNLEKILNTECQLWQLQGLDLSNADPLALLYQTGYLTIKNYDNETKLYRLGLPNQEVSRGLFNELVPYYISVDRGDAKTIVNDIVTSMLKGEPEKMMEYIDVFLAGIPYEMKMEDENNLHNAIFILLTLVGAQVETEVHTSNGRIDLLVKTSRFIYIIELKFGKDSRVAHSQIKEKQYALPHMRDQRSIYLIGANFNPATRRFDSPEISSIDHV